MVSVRRFLGAVLPGTAVSGLWVLAVPPCPAFIEGKHRQSQAPSILSLFISWLGLGEEEGQVKI